MITKTIDLYKYFNIEKPETAKGILDCYIVEKFAEFCPNRIRPAMLVIPGGGYRYCSKREKQAVAINFISKGYQAFCLEYSTVTISYPYQLLEACMATAYIRENAEEFGIDVNHIGAVGFSAGGHLCGMLATLFDLPVIKDFLKEKASLCRPDAVILSYPVIVSGEFEHKGSLDVISGNDAELREFLSLEKRVKENSVPAFIWSTNEDEAVPCENSFKMAWAYRMAKIPFELHIFEIGGHGLSLATKETVPENITISKWIDLAETWLKNRGFEIIDN